MSYSEELKQPEWNSKRNEILERDNFKCQQCLKERSPFRGLSSSFGIKTISELRNLGYSIFKPIDVTLNYNNILLLKDNFINAVHYIGNTERAFNLDDLKFAKQTLVFGAIRQISLLSFYEDTIQDYDLVDLNIHHKFYIFKHKPWEYENEALVSLCVNCHQKTHDQEDIIVYSQKGDKLYSAELCPKCIGSGYLKEFDYYCGGVCFQCDGEGVILNESI